MKPRNPVQPKKKGGKAKKNPLPPSNDRKNGDASLKVQEKPAPPVKQQIEIVEPTPTPPPPEPIKIVSPKPVADPVDFSVKHPLNNKWTLFYYLPERNVVWEKCQHQIHTVGTVEDFWSLVDHIIPPSELNPGVDYSFFKGGIRPMWEDPQNIQGGRLTVINAPKVQRALVDEVWLDVLLFLIGENYAHADSVCGVVLNLRGYGFKIAVWTSTQDKSKIDAIIQSIRASLSTSVHTIQFEMHEDTQKKAHVFNKSSSRGPN